MASLWLLPICVVFVHGPGRFGVVVTCQHPAKLDLNSYLRNPFPNDFGPAQTSDPVSHGDSIAL